MHVGVTRQELVKFRGVQFDPLVVDCLLEALDMGELSVDQDWHLEAQGRVPTSV
jgi:hypothetical protein